MGLFTHPPCTPIKVRLDHGFNGPTAVLHTQCTNTPAHLSFNGEGVQSHGGERLPELGTAKRSVLVHVEHIKGRLRANNIET